MAECATRLARQATREVPVPLVAQASAAP